MTSYTLDPSVRRAADGRVLVGGSPLVLLRLTAAGTDLIDRIERGDAPTVGDAAEPTFTGAKTVALLDRLLDAGVVHPHHPRGSSPADVAVVVPAYTASPAALRNIVEACSNTAEVIIVDDASPQPIEPIAGATVIRREVNGGPGAARMTGLEHVTRTVSLIAFVDTDVGLTAGWLDPLLAHFADPRAALVAPRVASAGDATSSSRLARYELVRSSLDLGPTAARVRAGTRVSYVPAAAIVCRRAALDDVGGFDQTLRFGEDVDLVWRLDEAGWRVRYEPDSVVHHQPRPTLMAWMRQRASYGGSAAALAERHPGALAPVRVSGWSAASWAAVVGGWPIIGGAVAAVTTALLARKLRGVPDSGRLALRLAGLGHLYAGRSLASGITREWWPLTAAAALVSKRARRAALLAVVVPALLDWRADRPALDPATYIALRLLDDASYGTGVIAGSVRTRSAAALRPDFRSWPKSGARSPRPVAR